MPTIFKYLIPQEFGGGSAQVGALALTMPTGAQLLSVGVQQGVPVLWALVNADAPLVPHHILIIGTGRDAAPADGLRFIGTYQRDWFVGHVFDGGE